MFSQLTPESVDVTRAEIDPHLLKCRECRIYLKEMYERKKKGFEEKVRSAPKPKKDSEQQFPIGMLIALSFSSSILATVEWLEWLRDSLESEVTLELDSVMEQVKQTAIELCPKDTGSLASSIGLENGVISAGDFYGANIYAGSEDVVNPKTGKATSEYAMLVHDGHGNYEGVPFLVEALMFYENELEACVSRALKEMGAGD